MSATDWLSALTAIATAGFGAGLLTIRAQSKKLQAEARHLDTENVTVFTDAANTLLAPLNTRVKELEAECKGLRTQVKELTAEVEHQRQVINETTVKLEAANRRADYYQRAFDERAEK